jgi:multidrug efflux system membrane fusion protein
LDEANGQLADDQAALQIAQLQVERARPLAASDLVAKQTFDTYTAQVKDIQEKIDSDNGAILAAQVNLDYCTIRSPVDGIAGFYNVNAGNVVFSKNQTVLTTIQRVTPIYLDFTVTGAELPDVQARFTAANGSLPMMAAYLARDDTWRNATLHFISNKVDQITGTVLVRGTYDNTDQHFWPGEAIRTQLILETLKNALLIPTRALALGQDGSYVFVKAADDTVARRIIKTGQREDDNIVVTDGLQAGESVVVTGQFMLKPGDKVKVVTPLSGNISGTLTTAAPTAARP